MMAEDLNRLDDAEFRRTVRQWLEANYPPELRNPPKRLHFRDNKIRYMKLAEKGWLAPGWPAPELAGLPARPRFPPGCAPSSRAPGRR